MASPAARNAVPCAALAIFLLVLCAILASQKISVPQLVSSASITLDENGTVSVSDGEMRDLSLNLSIPIASSYQRVQANDVPFFDGQGNAYLSISVQNPSNPFRYSRKIAVQSSERVTPSLPASFVSPPEYAQFAQATERTQSNDPRIRQAALQATMNSNTPFEKIAKLAIFVSSRMVYNESMVGQEKDALWTLQNSQGVCVEYATLYIALARSIGIPSRYVSGYVYSERFGGWMGHAWAESFIGAWVPVDPTWFEVGTLDALHIEAAKFGEISREPSLIASVSKSSAKIKWETTGKTGAFANNIATIEIRANEPGTTFEIGAAETSLPPGGLSLAYLTMEGKDYRVMPVSLSTCTGEEGISVRPGEQYLILEPGKNSTLVWSLEASNLLEGDYVFTCPLTVNSPYLGHRKLDVQIDPRLETLPDFQASLRQKNAAPGSQNSVLISLPAQRRGKSYVAITPDGVWRGKILSESGEIPFSGSSIGEIPVYVAGEGGGFQILSYSSGANTSVSIVNLTIPSVAAAGKLSKAHATILASRYPIDFSLEFSFGAQNSSANGRLNGPQDFEFEFTPESTGVFPARLMAFGPDGKASDEKNALVKSYNQPDVSISGVKITKDGSGLLATVSFSQKDEPLSAIVNVNGQPYKINDTVKIRLPEGDYSAVITWADGAGNTYGRDARLLVKDPGVGGVLDDAQSKSKPTFSCPLLSVLLFSALLFSFSKKKVF